MKVSSEPHALLAAPMNPAYHFKWIGLEAGPLSQWLFSALAEAGLPAICVETRHTRAVLKAQINKTDRNDARGIAQMTRVGLCRPVHVKTLQDEIQVRVSLWKDPRRSIDVFQFGLERYHPGSSKFSLRCILTVRKVRPESIRYGQLSFYRSRPGEQCYKSYAPVRSAVQ